MQPRRIAGLLLAAALAAQGERMPLTREQMAADLRQLADEANTKWAYAADRREHAGVDLEALAAAMIARLPEVKDDAAFVELVREFVASMQDGHAFVQWVGESLPFRRWPFTIVDTADGPVVDAVLPAWNGSPVPLQRGDLLLAIDGVPLVDLITIAERRALASTPGMRRHEALHQVMLGWNDPRRYTVRRTDGSDEELTAAAAAAFSLPAQLPVAGRALADGVGYVRIHTFAHGDAKAWAAAAKAKERTALLAQEAATIRSAFAAHAACRALVLDLRGNGGGTDLLGMEAAACLLPLDSVYYRLASKSWFGGWSRPSQHKLTVSGERQQFLGQLVVLIDEGVFSVTDNLCRCLDDLHPDVTFVGRPTGGGTGAPRPCVTLKHSGAVITFCTMRVYGPKGQFIEGRGTAPDVPMTRTRAGVLAGRDEDLEAALRVVR